MRRTGQHDDEMQVVDSSQYNQHDEDGTNFDHSIVPDLVIGERCFTLPGKHNAQIKFVGKIDSLPNGYWVGVQFDDKVGKNDGSLKGKVYFHCPPGHGGFLRSNKVVNEAALVRRDEEIAKKAEERERKREKRAKDKALAKEDPASKTQNSDEGGAASTEEGESPYDHVDGFNLDSHPASPSGGFHDETSSAQSGDSPARLRRTKTGRRSPTRRQNRGPEVARAQNCTAAGSGLSSVQCGSLAQFTITTYDEDGNRCPTGGSHIAVSIRGRASQPGTQPSSIRAKVVDRSDGTYQVEYKAWMSGSYDVAIVVEGEPIPGSPFPVAIITMRPEASLCMLTGEGLTNAVSRKPQKFEVAFKDSTGMPALAEELDVFVEPVWMEEEQPTEEGTPISVNHSADEVYSATTKGSARSTERSPTRRSPTRSPTSRSGSPTARGLSPTSRGHLASGIATGYRSPRSGGYRIDATTRQQHEALWTSRTSVDKFMAKKATEMGSRKKEKSDWAPNFAQELSMTDPFGFAFGGLTPGILHAHGRIAKVHTVQYSVGRAGKYKLHVNLRQQMIPMPGSPFDLTVAPGPGFAPCTRVPLGSESLSGKAAENLQHGMTLRLADMLGNLCIEGGAKVKMDLDLKAFLKTHPQYEQLPQPVTCEVKDLGNGSYDLSWQCLLAGTFPINIFVDGKHVQGSPLTLTVHASEPSVPHFLVSGSGMQTATAGEPADVTVKVIDRFGNASLPDANTTFGLEIYSGDGTMETGARKERQSKERVSGKASAGSKASGGKRNEFINGDKDAWCTTSDSMPIKRIWLSGGAGSQQPEAEVSAIFSKYDKDGSGDIDVDELTDALRELGLPCDAKQSEIILRKFAPPETIVKGEKVIKKEKTELNLAEFTNVVKEIRRTLKVSGAAPVAQGTCIITYVPQEAGSLFLHAWSFDTSGKRVPLPGSPFPIDVKVGSASASGSYVRPNEATPDLVECGGKLVAGEKLIVRTQVRDNLNNDTAAPEGALIAHLETPDGSAPTQINLTDVKGGTGAYELSTEPTQAGPHTLRILLNGSEVTGSPLTFTITAASFVPNEPKSIQRCKLVLPKSAPTPVINVPCELIIYAIDRYGNSITNGGHRVECKASGAATTPCTIEDNNNGTYTVSFSAGVPGEVKVVARVESMEIGPPLVLNFIRPEPKADAKADGKADAKSEPESNSDSRSSKAKSPEPPMTASEPSSPQAFISEQLLASEESSKPISTDAASIPESGAELEAFDEPKDEGEEVSTSPSAAKPSLQIPKKRSPLGKKKKGDKGGQSPKASPKGTPKGSAKNAPKNSSKEGERSPGDTGEDSPKPRKKKTSKAGPA